VALKKRANEMYIVYVGAYSDRYADCVTDDFEQAVTVRDAINANVLEGRAPSDMTAEIETIRAFRKGQRVPKNYK
jgi:hypothetical protein